MSDLSNCIEALAELHCLDVLLVQEMWAERASIMEHEAGLSRAQAELLALADIESELEGRK